MLKASFRTKVLVPVIVVMALLLAVSMWLVNRRVKEQIHENASEQLNAAEANVEDTQQHRANELLLRYKNVAHEPRIKAFTASEVYSGGQVQLDPIQSKTLFDFLDDLIKDGLCDAVALKPDKVKMLIQARDSQFEKSSFEISCSNSVAKAFEGQSVVETIRNGDHLFDIVTIPISFDTNSPSIFGTFTFAVENTLPQEFYNLTHSQLILISGGQIVASSDPEMTKSLPLQFAQMAGGKSEQEIVLNDEPFLWRAGKLNGGQLDYLILLSEKKPLQDLQSTQRRILFIGLAAVLLGAAFIWFLVSRVTRPLLELRDTAEAVGRGDFSRRVPVRSGDEIGKLAGAFNQMTGNIQQSRAQLEQTVETLKTTQAQLVQSEKLSAVGEFVAGVAHELNNPLAAVMGFSEMLKDADVGETHRKHLSLIFKAAQRCQKIVQSLLSFARRQKPERKPVSVNSLVEAVLEIVAYPLRTSNVEVETHFDKNLPHVLADEHQIQQVLLNIINNGRQAIETHQPGGKIKIVTESAEPNIRITISDNGPGISPENLQKIFDPFFTTKEVGKGTGLGLSLCYGLIKEHGGNITPMSKPGEGATFVIELPIARGVEVAKPTPSSELNKPNPQEGVGKRILVVDDEEILLQMMREELSQFGYDVVTAQDGEAGLREIQQHHFDAAFFDWKMPGLNGRQVYEQLRAMNPAFCQRVIFVTGDVVNEAMKKFLEAEKRPCLTKPFAMADLRNVIKSVLPTR